MSVIPVLGRQGHESHCKFKTRLWPMERDPGQVRQLLVSRGEGKKSQINNLKTFVSVYL